MHSLMIAQQHNCSSLPFTGLLWIRHRQSLLISPRLVETEQEMELLRALGCDFGQGFYFQAATRVEEIDHCYKDGLPLGRAFTA